MSSALRRSGIKESLESARLFENPKVSLKLLPPETVYEQHNAFVASLRFLGCERAAGWGAMLTTENMPGVVLSTSTCSG